MIDDINGCCCWQVDRWETKMPGFFILRSLKIRKYGRFEELNLLKHKIHAFEILHTVVAEIISPLSTRVNTVTNRMLLSVNIMKLMKTLRTYKDFLSAIISYARAAFTTSWKGFSHAYILITCRVNYNHIITNGWRLISSKLVSATLSAQD